MYGAGGVNDLTGTGETNQDVANLLETDVHGNSAQKIDGQILSTALSVYATDRTLAGGDYAASYGFIVTTVGTGMSTYNIPKADYSAFGISSNASSLNVSILNLLIDLNDQTSGGTLGSNSGIYNTVFSGINSKGTI